MSDDKNIKISPYVSIIVPVYKTAKYLEQCIESILNQDFCDFEVLLIDDGSPDNSPEICDQYAQKDARVYAIHKENGGVSSARNKGIDLSKGKYIVFIDSDDYVEKSYLGNMINEMVNQEIAGEKIFVISDYQPFSEKGYEDRNYPEQFSVKLIPNGMDAEQFKKLVFEFRIFPPYCKLYRRDIIEEENLRFDINLKSAEDFDFNIRYMQHVNRICYIPDTQYMYRVGYKKYIPSNSGILGSSEIKSVHIMANGIVDLAKRLNVYDVLYRDICLWAAKKHYYNRLPMLFAPNKDIKYRERKKLYRQLINDKVYYNAYKNGIALIDNGINRIVGSRIDYFTSWWLLYQYRHFRAKRN